MSLDLLAEQLESTLSTMATQQLLQNYLKDFQIKHYAFTYYAGHIKAGRQLRFECVSKGLHPWHQYYLEQEFANVDRTLEEAHTTVLPTYWNVHQQLSQAKLNREKLIRLESIKFGIDKGLSLPVFGPNHDFAILTLHQFRDERCLENYSKHQYEWLLVAKLFYNAIRRIIDNKQTRCEQSRLTKREKQCILLTARSWRVERIAKELKISSRTVNFHLQNANKKLGTNNKYQAAYWYSQINGI